MFARVLVLTFVVLNSALRVQHESHNNLANRTALSLHQQKEQSADKLAPCATSEANGAEVLTNYPRLMPPPYPEVEDPPRRPLNMNTGNGAGKLGCWYQEWETQAPFYLDIVASNALEARKWWKDELDSEDKQRIFKDLGFGDSTNYSQETKATLNGIFGQVDEELRNLLDNDLANDKNNSIELLGEISTNVYNTWAADQLNPGKDLSLSTSAKYDYDLCTMTFAFGQLSLFEYLKCAQKADPIGQRKHKHVPGSSPTNPMHGMQNHEQAFMDR